MSIKNLGHHTMEIIHDWVDTITSRDAQLQDILTKDLVNNTKLVTDGQWLLLVENMDLDSREIAEFVGFIKNAWFDDYIKREGSTPIHPIGEFFVCLPASRVVKRQIADIICSIFDLSTFPPQCWEDLIQMDTSSQLEANHVENVLSSIRHIHKLKLLYLGLAIRPEQIPTSENFSTRDVIIPTQLNSGGSSGPAIEISEKFADPLPIFRSPSVRKNFIVVEEENSADPIIELKLANPLPASATRLPSTGVRKLQPRIQKLVNDVIDGNHRQRSSIKLLAQTLSQHPKFGKSYAHIFEAAESEIRGFYKWGARDEFTIFRNISTIEIVSSNDHDLLVEVSAAEWDAQKPFDGIAEKMSMLRNFKTITSIAVNMQNLGAVDEDDVESIEQDPDTGTVWVPMLEYFLNDETYHAVKVAVEYFVKLYPYTDALFWYHIILVTNEHVTTINEHYRELFHIITDMISFIWYSNHLDSSYTFYHKHRDILHQYAQFLKNHISIEVTQNGVRISTKSVKSGHKPSIKSLYHNHGHPNIKKKLKHFT